MKHFDRCMLETKLSNWIKELSNWIKEMYSWIKELSYSIFKELFNSIRDLSTSTESSLNIWVSVNLAFHTTPLNIFFYNRVVALSFPHITPRKNRFFRGGGGGSACVLFSAGGNLYWYNFSRAILSRACFSGGSSMGGTLCYNSGTDVQADWRSCTYGRAPNAIDIS